MTLADWVNKMHHQPSERDIEMPWAQAAINECTGTWLDAGYVWTEPVFWEGVYFTGKHAIGLDIAPPRSPAHPFHETVVADVTEYDFPDADLITCISTLEHVGCDVRRYAEGAERRENPIALQQEAVRRMRSAKRLLVSVPFGMYEDHGWFIQYDLAMVNDLEPTTAAFYRLGGEQVAPEALADCLYQPNELRAEAVALMEFT